MTTTRRILGLLAPYRGRAALAAGLTIASSGLTTLVPLLVQGLVERLAAGAAGAAIPAYALGLLGVFGAQALAALAITAVIGPVGLGVVRDLRHGLYARLQRIGLSYYDRTPAGAILSRLTDDVAVFESLFTGQSVTILTDLATTVVILGLLIAQGTRTAVVVAAIMVAYACVFGWFTRRIRRGTSEVRDRLDRVFGHLKEKIDGMLVVKAYAREEAEIAEFAGRIASAHEPRLRVGRLGAMFTNLTVALNGVGTALVFGVAAVEVLGGRMTPGEAVTAATLAGLLFGPISRLADLTNIFEQTAASAERLGEILDMEPDVREPEHPVPVGPIRGAVEFDRVGFGYRPGRPVVWDVRLKIRPGMKVALVGPTGCGKSTLMNLLLKFYDPTWGRIRLDGVPLSDYASADLRRSIGVVLQDGMLFSGTLAENIAYGAPGADRGRIEAAARAAQLHEFAMGLPQGYDTVLGEGGPKLSRGEEQRVAIARAFCKDPALVILDEATSSLDTESEARIDSAIRNLLAGRTAFIIAHRLATVVDADLIVVMDGGLVVQTGTHEQLMAEDDGLYARLHARQFGDVRRHRAAAPRPRLLASPRSSKPASALAEEDAECLPLSA